MPGIKNYYIDVFPLFKKIIIIDKNIYKKNIINHLNEIFMLKKWDLLKFTPKYIDELKKKSIFFPLPIQFKRARFYLFSKNRIGKNIMLYNT
mmetsp:Transcript_2870/g.5497  ORF Transcript_2870/g.5497 Transcript_2870/m.5497 type:complete len:92 (-) Transcript_2870:4075-4350(-)